MISIEVGSIRQWHSSNNLFWATRGFCGSRTFSLSSDFWIISINIVIYLQTTSRKMNYHHSISNICVIFSCVRLKHPWILGVIRVCRNLQTCSVSLVRLYLALQLWWDRIWCLSRIIISILIFVFVITVLLRFAEVSWIRN